MGKPKGKDYLQDLGVDGRIELKRIARAWNGLIWVGIGKSSCEHGNRKM